MRTIKPLPFAVIAKRHRALTGDSTRVEVTAETLYEAAAQALSIFKQSEWAGAIGPGTELHVTVKNPETRTA